MSINVNKTDHAGDCVYPCKNRGGLSGWNRFILDT